MPNQDHANADRSGDPWIVLPGYETMMTQRPQGFSVGWWKSDRQRGRFLTNLPRVGGGGGMTCDLRVAASHHATWHTSQRGVLSAFVLQRETRLGRRVTRKGGICFLHGQKARFLRSTCADDDRDKNGASAILVVLATVKCEGFFEVSCARAAGLPLYLKSCMSDG